MPIAKSPNNIESGLNVFNQTLQGFLAAEQVNRDRNVEDRDYELRVDTFEENKRQFNTSFEEQVRQFDESLRFTGEQNQLNREHDIFIQDDQQEFLGAESALQRGHEFALQDDQQDWLEIEHKRDRALEYHRIKKNVEMANNDRALAWENYRISNMRLFLGESESYDQMPDAHIVLRDGSTVDPQSIKIVPELEAIVAGRGSLVFQPNMTPELAQKFLDAYNTDPQATMMGMINGGYVQQTPNTNKEQGLQTLMLQRMGGDVEEFNGMSPQDKERLRRAVIHDLNNVEPQVRALQREELSFYAQKQEAELGVSGYNRGGRITDPLADIAAANGNAFVWNSDSQFPVPSGLGGFEVSAIALEMGRAVSDALNYSEIYPSADDETLAAIANNTMNNLRGQRDRMRAIFKEKGIDPAQADAYFSQVEALMKGEPRRPELFQVTRRDVDNTASRPLSSMDGTLTGPITIGGRTYRPGEPGYDRALSVSQRQASLAQSQSAALSARQNAEAGRELESQEAQAVTAEKVNRITEAVYSVEGVDPDLASDIISRAKEIAERQPTLSNEEILSRASAMDYGEFMYGGISDIAARRKKKKIAESALELMGEK